MMIILFAGLLGYKMSKNLIPFNDEFGERARLEFWKSRVGVRKEIEIIPMSLE